MPRRLSKACHIDEMLWICDADLSITAPLLGAADGRSAVGRRLDCPQRCPQATSKPLFLLNLPFVQSTLGNRAWKLRFPNTRSRASRPRSQAELGNEGHEGPSARGRRAHQLIFAGRGRRRPGADLVRGGAQVPGSFVDEAGEVVRCRSRDSRRCAIAAARHQLQQAGEQGQELLRGPAFLLLQLQVMGGQGAGLLPVVPAGPAPKPPQPG